MLFVQIKGKPVVNFVSYNLKSAFRSFLVRAFESDRIGWSEWVTRSLFFILQALKKLLDLALVSMFNEIFFDIQHLFPG